MANFYEYEGSKMGFLTDPNTDIGADQAFKQMGNILRSSDLSSVVTGNWSKK